MVIMKDLKKLDQSGQGLLHLRELCLQFQGELMHILAVIDRQLPSSSILTSLTLGRWKNFCAIL